MNIAITGAIQLVGPLFDIFLEDKRGEHIVLAAYSHFIGQIWRRTTPEWVVTYILQAAIWRPSYGYFSGPGGPTTITAAFLLNTQQAATHLSVAEFNLLVSTIADYWKGFNYGVSTIFRPGAWTGFPTYRRSLMESSILTARNANLEAQQICRRPMDMRTYFSNEVPQKTSRWVGC